MTSRSETGRGEVRVGDTVAVGLHVKLDHVPPP